MRSLGTRDAMMPTNTPIHSSIRALDGAAISHLTFPASIAVPDASNLPTTATSTTGNTRTAKEAQDSFNKYLRETKNTICGRHPIGVLLGALAALEAEGIKLELRFTRYEVRLHLPALLLRSCSPARRAAKQRMRQRARQLRLLRLCLCASDLNQARRMTMQWQRTDVAAAAPNCA